MKKLVISLLLGTLALTAAAETPAVADLPRKYSDIVRLKKMEQKVRGLRPMQDGEHYTVLENNAVVRYAYATNEAGQALIDPVENLVDYTFSPDESLLLIAQGATPIYRHSYTTQYLLRGVDGKLRPIFEGLPGTRDASFSPDGRMILCSSNNDLYLYDIETDEVRRVTTDGEWNRVINGTTDWVYEEECGFTQAYAFSPDSRKIAFLRFDESLVPLFEMMRYDATLYNKAYTFKYPKAGDKNSTVELYLYDIKKGKSERVDVGDDLDQYLLQPFWTADGQLCYQRLNRRQNLYEVVLCDKKAQRVIYSEHSPTYVDHGNRNFTLLEDGRRFLVCQETPTGYMHLYVGDLKTGEINPVTSGEWEVTQLVGVRGKQVYYLSTESSPLRRDLYRIQLDGRRKVRLTEGDSYCSVIPGHNMNYYILEHSNATTPSSTALYTADGELVRTLCDNAELRKEVERIGLPTREFFTFTTERGDELNAYILKPHDFDPSKKYPVLLTQYSGPGSQSAADRWQLDWENVMVSHGYLVVCADGRGTGFRGEAFKKCTYGNLGALEVEDQLSTAHYMARQPYVDADRIGIYGWSYGGFMALGCALRGEGLFRMAIAVAPVTSWRFYDSIYTENFNGLPEEHAAGYDDNSPINLAHLLDDERTHLIIIHGTADDNVHFQNAMEMARALNRLGKQYDMMVYPDQNHSMMPDDTSNVRQKMIDYTLENL